MSMAKFESEARAALEEEREFLLRSLDDLESERSNGDISEPHYEDLKAYYTARAAVVIRALRDGAHGAPVDAPVPIRRRLAVTGAVLVFAVVAGGLLANSLGERLPGGTTTRNDPIQPTPVASADADGGGRGPVGAADDESDVCPVGTGAIDDLESAARTSTRGRLRYAGALLERGQAFEALRVYEEAAHLAPADPEPLTCGAQIVFAAGLYEKAMQRLDAALTIDNGYAPAYYLRGLFRLRSGADVDQAAADLRRALDAEPDGPFAGAITELLNRIDDG